MNIEILLGKTDEHLVPIEGTKFLVHKQMLRDFLKLQKESQEAGHDLRIISAFRNYERQLFIWNAKARGERKLLDTHGNELNYSQMSPTEIMFSILRWSAIPGCSRHHWGSDIDVFDAKTQSPEEVRLLPSECEGNGPASALHDWLDSLMDQKNCFGFFRPFKTDKGGVCPERWHLSYEPVSRSMQAHYTFTVFRQHIEASEILLKQEILEHAEEIYQTYIVNIDYP